MYRSPITIFQTQLETKMEDDILKAVQKQHIEVDKEELIKALAYDRGQYDKGYADAEKEFTKKLDRIVEALEEGRNFYLKRYEKYLENEDRSAYESYEDAIEIIKGEV